METLDVACIGEALVDFLPRETGRKVRDVENWVRCTGGSPANVAVGLARLGARSAMLGVVGQDEFGLFLKQSLAQEGVDVSHLRQTNEGKTGLVFISLDERGERSFSFYRTNAAELFLDDRDVDPAFLSRARAIHCGTNSLLWPKSREAMRAMAEHARAEGKIVCCDPNLRLHLWANPDELRELLRALLPMCSVVKLAQDEIEFVTGTSDVDRALVALKHMGVLLPVVTSGPDGATFLWAGQRVQVPALAVTAVDTTGAGDGFTAALLFGLTRLFASHDELARAGVGELREVAAFACRVASCVVQKVGAVAGLPRFDELLADVPMLLRAST